MSIFTKILTSVFGTKSGKDLKVLEPVVLEINNYYQTLENLTDDELKSKFNDFKNQLSTS